MYFILSPYTDYEVYEVSSDDDAAIDEGEDEVLPTGAIRRRKNPANKEYVPPTPIHVPGSEYYWVVAHERYFIVQYFICFS